MESDAARIVEDVIHRRASGLTIDRDAAVDAAIIERLARAAQAAPNHRKTRPLRLAVVRGDGRSRLGETVADVMRSVGDDETKVDKALVKYLRAPVVLVVASAPGASGLETEENRYSVAAGIQNMLVLAEALGLCCLWSTPATGANDALVGLCDFDEGDHVVGIVYVGWPTRDTPLRERPEPRVTWID